MYSAINLLLITVELSSTKETILYIKRIGGLESAWEADQVKTNA
jgi:hypothetical protein